jgi:type IV pilus assembly protein PilC
MLFASDFIVRAVDRKTRLEYVFELKARKSTDIEQELASKYFIKDISLKTSPIVEAWQKLTMTPINNDDILRVLSFLAGALGRGVVLRKALEFLYVSEQKPSVKALIKTLLERLEEQFSSYYDIFKDFPEYFDNTFLGIVRAGEATGSLSENILQYVADQKKMKKQKDEILAVFMKRLILFIVVMGVATVIVTFVIPQFFELFKESKKVPQVLVYLMNIANFIKNYSLYVLVSIIAAVSLFFTFLKSSYQFKKNCDRKMLKIPLVGELIRTYYTCQYLYFTGSLLKKNVNYIKIMEILIDQISSIPFKELFETMKQNVLKGVELADMLRRSEQGLETHYEKLPKGLLLPSLVQALEMGAATGNMGQILYDSYLSYEEVFFQKMQTATKIFDKIFYSVIIVIMGVLFYAMGVAMMTLYQNSGQLT